MVVGDDAPDRLSKYEVSASPLRMTVGFGVYDGVLNAEGGVELHYLELSTDLPVFGSQRSTPSLNWTDEGMLHTHPWRKKAHFLHSLLPTWAAMLRTFVVMCALKGAAAVAGKVFWL
ncbi:unnamed protein product [Schistocephalus solidus]|uniref:CIA30 domain-containing protein n=1 Tax=Schistocephalus solidus TaxID=70667 RepID=A0A183T9V6_SCHSO|nr:unnamed protein product [Schistocephalus solidus]